MYETMMLACFVFVVGVLVAAGWWLLLVAYLAFLAAFAGLLWAIA
jgi:hypothetical protein